ncbi:MAG: 50S ribosomal protein L24 [bacterium]
MKIKTGDKVKITAGKDKGKSGKVLQIFVATNRVVVEGANMLIKNQKARKQGEKGQRIQFPAPLNIANVMLICPKCGKDVRVGYQINKAANGKQIKSRICKGCKEVI